MERSKSGSPVPANPDDSWTCQRCGWVYPNAHPSAKHRRNHKKHCGKIKGSEFPPEPQKGGSSDEVSSGEDSRGKKDILHPTSTTAEASGAGLAVEHPNDLESRNLLATEANVSDRVNTNRQLPESILTPFDTKQEVVDREAAGDIISIDTTQTDSSTSESKPDNVLLDSPLPVGSSAPHDAQPEVIHHESTQDIIDIDAVKTEASDPEPNASNVFMENSSMPGEEGKKGCAQHIQPEERPTDLATTDEAVTPVAKLHALQDSVLAVDRSLPELDSDQSKKTESKDEKSEQYSPKNTDNKVSMEESSNYSQSESKRALTPTVGTVEPNAHETRGLDSDDATLKGRSLMSKEEGLSRQGSSQGDDSWMCHRCGWVYPNPRPSAKHRKKHKKKCGKIKGFPLITGLHDGGSSDEVTSSDEDVHAKKEHTSDQATQVLQPWELNTETGAPESISPRTVHPTIIAEGEIIAESESNSRQPIESNTLKEDASDRALRDSLDVKDISSPDIVLSNVPVLPENVPSLDQQDLPAVIGHENLKSPEIQSPSLPEKDDTSPNDVSGDLGKDTQLGHSRKGAPMVADIPVIADLKSFDPSTPVIQPSSDSYSSEHSLPEMKDATFLKIDEPNAVISGMDRGGSVPSNEALDVSAGEGQHVTDVSEKPGFSGFDTVSDLAASDDIIVGNPSKKETGDPLTLLESYDSPSQTLPADEVTPENKSVTENLLPQTGKSAAFVTGLTQDAERNEKVPSAEASVSPVEHAPKNEPSTQITDGGNDCTFSSSVAETSLPLKINGTSPVPNWEQPAGKQIASGAGTDLAVDPVRHVQKNESSEKMSHQHSGGNDIAQSPTVEKIDETPLVPQQEHSSDDQVAFVPSANVDVPRKVTEEGTSVQRSLDGSDSKNLSSVSEGPGHKGETQKTDKTSGYPEDIPNIAAVARDKKPGGSSASVQKERDDKIEAGGAQEGIVDAVAKEEISRGVKNSETHSFSKAESAATLPSELGGSSHKLSDSLDVFEDAQDTLETCSVGGSVDENEGLLDEPRQASGRLQEPKHLETALLDATESEDGAALHQNPTVSSSSSFVKSSSEEKTRPLSGTSFGERTELGGLKAPSPEAWQEPTHPSSAKSKGKKPSTSEVTEDSRSRDSRTALRSLMAKDVPSVETSAAAEDRRSPSKKDGSSSSATADGKKTKSRPFWRFCTCCSSV